MPFVPRSVHAALAVLVFLGAASASAQSSDPPAPVFDPLPGFRVERAADSTESLIALTIDDRGRVLASRERGGVVRLADDDGDGRFEAAEVFTDAMRGCQGLLWSKGSLFAVGHGPSGLGLYRIDVGEAGPKPPRLLGAFTGGGGEHGPHAVIEGPGGRLWLALGNHTSWKGEPSARSPYRIFYEGHVVPRYLDPRGHARDVEAPGGVVVSTDRDGRDWQLFAGGFRNVYDIAFDEHGDLFAFDSDMEWDIGLPWYRPCRLLHVVPGGEYGWRTGSSKWPEIHPDSLPPAADVGRASPTGLVHYAGRSFPPRYRGALLGGDWAKGRILAFRLQPRGASFRAHTEILLRGRPLNVTDLEVDAKGALLFSAGGRGTKGGIFRLSFEGDLGAAGEAAVSTPRRKVALGGKRPRARVLAALGDPDRFVRFAAARELERRGLGPPAGPQPSPLARAERLVVEARIAGAGLTALDFRRIGGEALDLLDTAEEPPVRYAALRALELILCDRSRRAPPTWGPRVLALHPTGDRAADRELVLLIARLRPPGAVAALVAALAREPSRLEQIHLVYGLRLLSEGWTRPRQRAVVDWVSRSLAWPGGASYRGYIERLAADLGRHVDEEGRSALEKARHASTGPNSALVSPGAPARDFDRTLGFVRNALDSSRRSPAEGARVFERICAACHQLGEQGRGAGPILTDVGSRFSHEDLLWAIVDPSRQISDLYRAVDVFTKRGDVVSGLPIVDDGRRLALLKSSGERVEVEVEDIDERRFAKLSVMPSGLLDGLTLEEVADLFAYLRGGRSHSPPAEPAWRRLLDGRGLTGWKASGSGWSAKRRSLAGRSDGKSETAIVTELGVRDFAVEAEVLVERGTARLGVRIDGSSGYGVGLGGATWGSLYRGGAAKPVVAAPGELVSPALDRRGWNHLVVTANGEALEVELNGIPCALTRDAGADGTRLSFALSAGAPAAIRVRNLRVRSSGGR